MSTETMPTTALTAHVDYPTVEKFRSLAYYNEITNTELYTKAMEFAAKHKDFESFIKNGIMAPDTYVKKPTK